MVKTKYRAQANTEWNLFRTENYDRIIEAMESNLAGLKEVRSHLSFTRAKTDTMSRTSRSSKRVNSNK